MAVIEKLQIIHPEMALFAATCIVLLIGLSGRSALRSACAPLTGVALLAAAWLGLQSPGADSELMQGMPFPGLLPYAKTLIALIGLLILPMLAGTVDRSYEKAVERGEVYNPMRSTRGEFYAFFMLSLIGVMLCATADDLIWLFLALELTSLPTYIMVAMSTSRLRSQEAGVKYFFLGAFGAAMFLYGFALLYGATGSTFLSEIREAMAEPGGAGPMAMLGLVMVIVGVSFKIAAVPMHFYAADVYQGAGTTVAAFLAFAPKAAGFFTLLILLGAVGWTHGPNGDALPPELRVILWVIAALTMTIGNTLALLQTSVKRILAYSSVAHSGYMLVGLIAGPGAGSIASNGLAAMLFYLLCYGVMTTGAFAAIAALERRAADGGREEIDSIEDLRGLCRVYPLVGWSMVVCSLSLLGLPPLLGFFGKLMLFTSAISAGEIVLVVVMGLNSAVAAFYYLRLAGYPLLEQRHDEAESPTLTPAPGRRLAACVAAVGVVALVVFISPLQRASHEATQLTPLPAVVEVKPASEAEVARR
ncbi:MAG: NADH-quinone oxidoreductase subunit N [Phycisphaeraceae bacterium]|nr:MAG: NADH-quinone oxidoreductase subunit N [Phycisphaeraceae bacterium]